MTIQRAFRRSFTEFKRHPWLHVTSVMTITVSLLILGGFFLCYRNFETLAEKSNPSVTGTAYLKEGITEAEVAAVKQKVLALPGVASANFKSRTSVVEDIQAFLGSVGTDQIPGGELFPDVLEIEMKKDVSSQGVAVVKSGIAGITDISEIDFSEDWLGQYKRIRQFLKFFGLFLMFAVVVGCSFIIANFMGIRHQSRREEIEIVRLIGAQDNFILKPFLIEGVSEGVVGSVLALIFLAILRSLLSTLLSGQWTQLLGIRQWQYLSFGQVLLVFLVGIAMAVFGSITVFLRFQERTGR